MFNLILTTMVNLWHDIERKKSEEFNAVVEIPKDSRVKYEVDKDTGLIYYDRVLHSPMHYSSNYGFIPQSLWDDGDPMDVLLMSQESLVPGCIVKCRPIGVLDMVDDGDEDAKILAVPVKDPRFDKVNDISDVDPHYLREVKHFFSVYKELQGKKVEVKEWEDRSTAIECVEKSFENYDKEFSNN